MDHEDPLQAALIAEAAELKRRREAHDRERAAPEYQAAITRIRKTVQAFADTMRICMIASTRWPQARESFFLEHISEMSTAAAMGAVAFNEGAINAGRRELRFLLELAMQAAYVDEAMRTSPFAARLEFFDRKVKHQSANHVRDLALTMLGPDREEFTKAVIAAWSEASNYVHPTARQIRETLELRAAGAPPGFETATELVRAGDALEDATTYVVVVAFHVIGPPLTGDILVDALDREQHWPFHANRFIAAIDTYFDYKAERQRDLNAIRARRTARVRR